MSHAHAHHVRGAACNEPPSLIKVKDSCVVTKCESLYETQHRLNFSLGLIISLICKHWKVIASRHDALTHLRISSFYLSFLSASYLQLFFVQMLHSTTFYCSFWSSKSCCLFQDVKWYLPCILLQFILFPGSFLLFILPRDAITFQCLTHCKYSFHWYFNTFERAILCSLE